MQPFTYKEDLKIYIYYIFFDQPEDDLLIDSKYFGVFRRLGRTLQSHCRSCTSPSILLLSSSEHDRRRM